MKSQLLYYKIGVWQTGVENILTPLRLFFSDLYLLMKIYTCRKNTSAFAPAGGKQINGHKIVFGPASYIFQT